MNLKGLRVSNSALLCSSSSFAALKVIITVMREEAGARRFLTDHLGGRDLSAAAAEVRNTGRLMWGFKDENLLWDSL